MTGDESSEPAGGRTPLESQVLAVASSGILLAAVAFAVEQLMTDTVDAVRLWALFGVGFFWLAAYLLRRPTIVWVCAATLLLVGLSPTFTHFSPAGRQLGLIVFPLLAVVFVKKHEILVLVTLALISSGLSLGFSEAESFGRAVAMFAGLTFVGFAIIRVRQEEVAFARRAETLFDSMPIAMLDQDWSLVFEAFEKFRDAGVEDIKGFLENDPDLMVLLLMSAKNLAANQAAAEMYGVPSPEALLGPPLPNLVDDENREYFLDVLVDLWNGTTSADRLFPARTADGRRIWQQIRGFPHPDRPGGMILAMVDVTALQNQREELADLHISKDRFVASISHELRTPLSAVVGFLAELESRWEAFLPEERVEFTCLASREARQVSNIVEDLLVTARADIGGVVVVHERVNVADAFEDVLISQEEVETEIQSDLPSVCGDVTRIVQVVRNLISNAVRYGGPRRRIRLYARGDEVIFEARDNGDPLTESELARVFEPYERIGDRPGVPGSVGLGLTVAKQLSELMGGSLTVGREEDETVFRFSLPVWGRCSKKESSTKA